MPPTYAWFSRVTPGLECVDRFRSTAPFNRYRVCFTASAVLQLRDTRFNIFDLDSLGRVIQDRISSPYRRHSSDRRRSPGKRNEPQTGQEAASEIVLLAALLEASQRHPAGDRLRNQLAQVVRESPWIEQAIADELHQGLELVPRKPDRLLH
jgi:hypothetical protein